MSVVRLGEVVQAFDALAEPAPEDPARAEADQRLHVLEPGAGRVLPRVEEGEKTIAPVRRRPRGDRGEPDHEAVGRGEQRHPRPRDEQDRADDEHERERRPEIGLDEHEHREERGRGARSASRAPSACAERRRFERYEAVQTTSASFASSDGWKTSGPTSIQRRAPLMREPTASTPTQRMSAVTTRVGASARSCSRSRRETTSSSDEADECVDRPAARRSRAGWRRRARPIPRSRCRPSRARRGRGRP